MPAAKNNVTVCAEMPRPTLAVLDARARAEGRTRSNAINRAVEFWIDEAELTPKPVAIEVKPKRKSR